MPLQKKEPKMEEEICGSHILFNPQTMNVTPKETNELADKVIKELEKKPDDFGIAAFVASDCPSGKRNKELVDCVTTINKDDPEKQKKIEACIKTDGGKLGCFKPNQMVPEFSDALQKLQVGQIGKVHTQFGDHIIRRDKKPLS